MFKDIINNNKNQLEHQNPLEQIDISDNESINNKEKKEEEEYEEDENEEEEEKEEKENDKDEEEREWRETNLRIYLEKLKSYSLAVDKPKKVINENKENYSRPIYTNSKLDKFKIDSCIINIFIPASYDTPFRFNLLEYIEKRNKENPNNNREYEIVYPMMPFFSPFNNQLNPFSLEKSN